MKKAFTLIELIFVIIVIGVLSAVAIPKFAGMSDNSKIAAELATAASVQTALDACNGEWTINEGSFTCGNDISSTTLNAHGYPDSLGDVAHPLNAILKNANNIGWTLTNANEYRGPASDTAQGAANCKTGKPCKSKYWEYSASTGTFKLVE